MRKVFDLEFARRREHNKVKMAEMIDKYKLREGDNSSAEVQGNCEYIYILRGKTVTALWAEILARDEIVCR